MQYYRRIRNCIKPDPQDFSDNEDLDMQTLRTKSPLNNQPKPRHASVRRNRDSMNAKGLVPNKSSHDLMRNTPQYNDDSTGNYANTSRRVKSQQSRRHSSQAGLQQNLNEDQQLLKQNSRSLHSTPLRQDYTDKQGQLGSGGPEKMGSINSKINKKSQNWSNQNSSPSNSMIGPGMVSQQSMGMNQTQGSNQQFASLGGSSSTSHHVSKMQQHQQSHSQQSQYQTQQQLSLLQTAQSDQIHVRSEPDRMMQEIKSMVDDIKCKKLHLQEMIGQGAHGVVYKGSWNKQEVAIKVIMFEGDKEIKRKNSAIVEAAISSSLSHPQVLQSYAYSIERMRGEGIAHDLTGAVEVTGMTTEGSSMTVTGAAEIGVYKLYLVQEFCDMGNLTDFLRQAKFINQKTGELNFIMVCMVLSQIAKGMRHLHLNNIVHGDLKTNNILMRTYENQIGMTAKVSDFGLSVRLQESQSFISGRFAGTPFYVAPEVVQHGRLSKRADVFSFGVVMWELYNQEMIYQLATQQTGQNLSKSAVEPRLTTNQTFPTFPVSCPLPYALLCALCLSPNYHDRPDFNMVTQILDSLREESFNGNIRPGEHNKYVNENFITDDTPITIEQVLGYIQTLCTYNQSQNEKARQEQGTSNVNSQSSVKTGGNQRRHSQDSPVIIKDKGGGQSVATDSSYESNYISHNNDEETKRSPPYTKQPSNYGNNKSPQANQGNPERKARKYKHSPQQQQSPQKQEAMVGQNGAEGQQKLAQQNSISQKEAEIARRNLNAYREKQLMQQFNGQNPSQVNSEEAQISVLQQSHEHNIQLSKLQQQPHQQNRNAGAQGTPHRSPQQDPMNKSQRQNPGSQGKMQKGIKEEEMGGGRGYKGPAGQNNLTNSYQPWQDDYSDEVDTINSDINELQKQMQQFQQQFELNRASSLQGQFVNGVNMQGEYQALMGDGSGEPLSETIQQLDQIQEQIHQLQFMSQEKKNKKSQGKSQGQDKSQGQGQQNSKIQNKENHMSQNVLNSPQKPYGTQPQNQHLLPLQGDIDVDFNATYNVSNSFADTLDPTSKNPSYAKASPNHHQNPALQQLQQQQQQQYQMAMQQGAASRSMHNKSPPALQKSQSTMGNYGNNSNSSLNRVIGKVAYQIPQNMMGGRQQTPNTGGGSLHNKYNYSMSSMGSSVDMGGQHYNKDINLKENGKEYSGNIGVQDLSQFKNYNVNWPDVSTMGESIKNQPLNLVNLHQTPNSRSGKLRQPYTNSQESSNIYSNQNPNQPQNHKPQGPNPNQINHKMTNINSNDVSRSKLDMQVQYNENLMNFYWTNWSLFSSEDGNIQSNDNLNFRAMHDTYKMKKLVQAQNGQYNAIPRSQSNLSYKQQQLQFREKY